MNKSDLTNLIRECILEAKDNKTKLKRDIFIYLDPKGENQETFAQCSNCILWTTKTCFILGKRKITKDMSCNFNIPGNPTPELSGNEESLVTPAEAGLVKRNVRCENCRSFDTESSECMLYKKLNEDLPDLFHLDVKVNSKGCCNAQMPKDLK